MRGNENVLKPWGIFSPFSLFFIFRVIKEGLSDWICFSPSGPQQRVREGGICELGAALLWVYPARRLLPWRLHVHPHLARRSVRHCLCRRECRRTLFQGPWYEDGGIPLGLMSVPHPKVNSAGGVRFRQAVWWWEGNWNLVTFSLQSLFPLLSQKTNLIIYLLEFSMLYSYWKDETDHIFFMSLKWYAFSFRCV